jgi:hypothetical protein
MAASQAQFTPVAQTLRQTPMAASQAQFTPVAQTLRQTIGQVHPHRTANPASTATPAKVVETKFQVRIAHGSHETATKTLTWQVYPDTWSVRVNNAIATTWFDFIWGFKSSGYNLQLSHINALLDINGDGKWAVTTNWLDKKNPIPRYWQPWSGARLISDALKDTDYPALSKTAGPRQCYEVTLLWCPEQSRRLSISSLESFSSVRDLLAPQAPPGVAGPPPAMPETLAPPEVAGPPPAMPEMVAPPAAAITEDPPTARPKPAANTAHKRQISEAIPRNERPIARQARPEPAERDAREDHQEGAEGDAAADITTVRRSGRAPKPKQRS